MKNKTILLTGGIGYIGSHVYIQLVKNGYTPVIFDNFSNSFVEKIKKIQKYLNQKIIYFKGDILNKSELQKVFSLYSFSGVIHLAALKSVTESDVNYVDYYQNNISGLINLIDVMSKNGVKKIIFSSSATVYGDNAISPVNENMRVSSNNTYGLTKIIDEDLLRNLCKVDKEWSSISLRYFNPAGCSDIDLLNEEPKKIGGNLFPIIQNCIENDAKKTFYIFGNDYNTPDGTPIRDFIHVEDLATSHILALEKLETESNYFKTINVGSGNPKTVLEIIKSFEKISNKKINVVFKERRPNDIGASYANIELAKKELGFEPTHNLESICRSSLKV